jgi:hypothetical protein
VAITKAAVRWVADGGAADATTARALIVDFGRRYLAAWLPGCLAVDPWLQPVRILDPHTTDQLGYTSMCPQRPSTTICAAKMVVVVTRSVGWSLASAAVQVSSACKCP